MHCDLSPHLHTDVCNKAIADLHRCYKEETLGKFSPTCSGLYKRMTVCLKSEREIFRKENQGKAKKRQEKVLHNLEQNKNNTESE